MQLPPTLENKITTGASRDNLVFKVLSRYWITAFALFTVVILGHAIYVMSLMAYGSLSLDDKRYYIAKEGQGIEQIMMLPAKNWEKPNSLIFETDSATVWLKLNIPKALLSQASVLRFNDPLIDQVKVHVGHYDAGEWQGQRGLLLGDTFAFENRSFALPNIVVPISASNNDTIVFIGGSSKFAVNLAVGLWTLEEFIEFNSHTTIFFGMLFGYILALVCYSMLMYTTARKSEYMWYCAYLFGFAIHLMSISGYAYQYIWPSSESFQNVAGGISISLAFLFLTKFTEILIAPTKKWVIAFFKFFTYANLLIALLGLLSLNPMFVKLSLAVVILTCFGIPFLCLGSAKSGSKMSKHLGHVWLTVMIIVLVTLLDRFQVFSLNIDPLLLLIFGFHLQTLLTGSGLIYGYRSGSFETLRLKESAIRDEAEAIKAKDQILALQKDAQLKLQAQVKQQTLQLENALNNLSLASKELEQLRNVDGLTGLPNRLAFDEALDELAKTAVDFAKPLCLAVVDIDHFKQVNDTYGHLAGDDCLRAFSQLLKDTFERRDYSFCRFGGEEFVVASLLPFKQFEKQLNIFKDALQALDIQTSAGIIKIKTSAGIASKRLIDSADTRKLYAKADENLYLAKQKGRNLVIASVY